jgi:hypothetical protein
MRFLESLFSFSYINNPPALPVDYLFEDLKQLVHDGLG